MVKLSLKKEYKPYKEYKDSGVGWIGNIPSDWNSDYLRGYVSDNDIKNIKGEEKNLLSLSYGNIIQKDIEGLGGLLPESFNTYQIINHGDIVLRLTDLQNDKKSLRVGYVEDDSGIITSAYTGLKINKQTHSKFLYYLLHSYDLQKVFYNLGGGVRQGLKYKNLKYLPLVIPPKEEQEKIADFLDEKITLIDSIIEKKKTLIELLKEKRSAVINHAVTKGLDPKAELVDSGVEWIGKIPKNWEMKKIKHILKETVSGIWGGEELDDRNDIKCLRIADFNFANLTYNTVETVRNNINIPTTKVLQEGDLIIERSGGGEKTPVGRTIIYDGKERMTCANFMDIVRVDKESINPNFLVAYLYSLYVGGFVRKYIKQNTGIQNLDIKKYFSEPVTFPQLSEQKKIVEYINSRKQNFRESEDKVLCSIKKLQEFKSSLISHAVTGKIKI